MGVRRGAAAGHQHSGDDHGDIASGPHVTPIVRRGAVAIVPRMLFGREHVKRYIETDGEEGHDWRNGAPVLLITTTGRRSGEPRTTPLIYGRNGDDYLIVASKGGAPEPPAWYRNLSADPHVQLQVKADRFAARARTATPEERGDLWRTMTAIWPDYDAYQKKTGREIPVVVLQRER
jgi:deazaflavin-dependent oxidoreductase (nitroreductase family)